MAKTLPNIDLPVPGDRDTNYMEAMLWLLYDWIDGLSTHLDDPTDPLSDLNTSGGVAATYQVKVESDDIPDYLREKIVGLNGVTATVSTGSNKVISLSLDIQETTPFEGVSLLSNTYTLKQPVAGDNVTITSDSEKWVISSLDNKTKISAADNSNGYLENKLIDGINTTVTKTQNGSGDQFLQIDASSGLPLLTPEDATKKVVGNATGTAYELVASTTNSGFNSKTAQTLSFDNGSLTATITPTMTDYTVTYSNGKEITKTTDSIPITNVNGIHGIYYNDTTGVLETFPTENKEQIWDHFQTHIIVGWVEWSVIDQVGNIVTTVFKDRTMSVTTFSKNFFDKAIYVLSGMTVFDDPSFGGSVTPDSSLNTSAQVGFTAGTSLLADAKYPIPVRAIGHDWAIIYKDPSSETRSLIKTDYLFLQELDIPAIGSSARILYNNAGSPTACGSGNFVWYSVGIINDIDEARQVISFMGENEYSTKAEAQTFVDSERIQIASSMEIEQQVSLIYMVLLESKSSFSNDTQARIVDVQVVVDEGGSVSAGGGVFPADLVNGSDASYLHNHLFLYGSPLHIIRVSEDGSGADHSTITSAINAAVMGDSIHIYKGTYVENLTLPIGIPLIGIGSVLDVVIQGEILVSGGDCTIDNIVISHITSIENQLALRVTGGGNLSYRRLLVNVIYTGDIGTTGIKVEGTSHMRGAELQVLMTGTTSNNGIKNIIAIDAPNITSVDTSINNNVFIQFNSPDINDNFIGFKHGGAGAVHDSNVLFEYSITNVNYSGNMIGFEFDDDTTIKTFGDVTVRCNDAGSGNLICVKVNANSGSFQMTNLNAYYDGSGTAKIATVAAGATLIVGSGAGLGFTDIYTGAGAANIRMLIDGVDQITVDLNVDGDITTANGSFSGKLAIDPISSSTSKLNIGNSTIFADSTATSSILLTNQGGSYAIGTNTQAIVWAQQNSNGSTPGASISLESIHASGGTSDLIFKTVGNASGETFRLKNNGGASMSNLPDSSSGLSSGDWYTQTASQLGGSGTIKVICVF